MRITDNTIQYDGRTLYQVARFSLVTYKEELGGYVESKYNLPTNEDSWIELGAKVYGTTKINGKIYIHKDVVIKDTQLSGNFIIDKNCTIINSDITAVVNHMHIENGSSIHNCSFRGCGVYESYLFNDGYFNYQFHNTIHLIMTKNYCKVGCLTMDYATAWKYLNDESEWNRLALEYYKDSRFIFTTTSKNWLREQCIKGLKNKVGN